MKVSNGFVLPFMSSFLCKKERGYLLAFRIQVKENGIEDLFHTISINKDPHRSCPSSDFTKCSFNRISRPNPPLCYSFGNIDSSANQQLIRTRFGVG